MALIAASVGSRLVPFALLSTAAGLFVFLIAVSPWAEAMGGLPLATIVTLGVIGFAVAWYRLLAHPAPGRPPRRS
jgi:hypothetical protein